MAAGRRVLEHQAHCIEAVLAQHRVRCAVRGGVVTPRTVRFEVQPEPGVRARAIEGLSSEIALALGTREARVYREGDAVQVEVARAEADAVRLLPLCSRLAHIPPATAVLGVDGDGAPLLLRLPAADVAHVLIAGATGCGKTALARTLLTSLAMFNTGEAVQLVLIDPRARGLAPLAQLPHVLGDVASSADAMMECLSWLAGEMHRRERSGQCEPCIVVAVDELADLLHTGGSRAEAILTRLSQRGREAGIHLVACMQKPIAELIGDPFEANFPIRLVGCVASGDEASYAAGMAESGAQKLEGRGDFLLVLKGESIRFQAAWVGRRDLEGVSGRLREGGGTDWSEYPEPSPARFTVPSRVEKGDPDFALQAGDFLQIGDHGAIRGAVRRLFNRL